MKNIIKFLIFIFVGLSIFFFNKKYFLNEKKEIFELGSQKKDTFKEDKDNINNIIKNLVYEVKVDRNKFYQIKSKYGEIVNYDGIELIKMKDVKAILSNNKSDQMVIKSDEALYNNSNYSTDFFGNLIINYQDSIIEANILKVNFQKNEIKISENVKFSNPEGIIKSDNIKIDILTKNTQLYMDNKNSKVQMSNYSYD